MTLAILTLLGSLVPFAIWLWKRHDATEDNPYHQHELHQEQLAKEIIQNDETAANQSLDEDLDRLRALTLTRSDAPHALPDPPDRLRSLQSDLGGQNSPPPQSP